MIDEIALPFRSARTQLGRMARVTRFAEHFTGSIARAALLTLALAALNAAEPLLLKFIFDQVARPDPLVPLAVGVGLLLATGASREGAAALSDRLVWKTRLGIQYNLLEKTLERLHHQPLDFYRQDGTGAVLTRLDRSINGLVEAVTRLLFTAIPSFFYLVIAAVVMIRLEPTLALLVLALAPVPALIQARAASAQIARERGLLERWSRIYSRFGEVLSGIVTVRSFAMEESERRRFLTNVAEANSLVIRGVGTDAGFTAAANLAILAARVVAVAVGCALVVQGTITVGTLVAFLGYVTGLFVPVQGLSGLYQTLRKARVSLDDVCAILDAESAVPDRPDAIDPGGPARGDVVFRRVTFTYVNRPRPALQEVNVALMRGTMSAVVGPSGSGKTTLSALLMRLYDPSEGAVLIDGRDVRTLKQAWIRRNVGVVLQEPLLFNDTVRANIAYGRPGATRAQIEAAARAANAHDFVARLPEGYETVVGERGGRLSLGERQRITIARALVKDAPILILDEATSSLDAESEALVEEALARLVEGRTVLVIAHRLATVVRANRIIVLREGRIAEYGSHDELLQREGWYASLVRSQKRRFDRF